MLMWMPACTKIRTISACPFQLTRDKAVHPSCMEDNMRHCIINSLIVCMGIACTQCTFVWISSCAFFSISNSTVSLRLALLEAMRGVQPSYNNFKVGMYVIVISRARGMYGIYCTEARGHEVARGPSAINAMHPAWPRYNYFISRGHSYHRYA